ncbi:phage virion morphogenesis protein [uncultured Alistipes sp.]|uniref:phage virion morphogenesis protein n=1 Tax=uncultured Alistipes sp. TaxID=538949 RepID=UPI00260DE082|nr:phage virion morphogenesis protein [uncultured Alistipes sp.]
MDPKEFSKLTQEFSRELETFVRRTAPVIVGRLAENHFRDNFRQGGFVDRELRPWPRTRRQQSGAGTAESQYGPLLSSREHLMLSVEHTTYDYGALVYNRVPYAPIHNWGGTTHPTVTPRMRRYAWWRYYAAGGGKKNGTGKTAGGEEAEQWKRLALTKKKKLTVRIPQRQFLGTSARLEETIRKELENELEAQLIKLNIR